MLRIKKIIIFAVSAILTSAFGPALAIETKTQNAALPGAMQPANLPDRGSSFRLAGIVLDTDAAEPNPESGKPATEKRIALVIGNGNYPGTFKLQNPARDAEAVAVALRATGFESVEVGIDLSRSAMLAALRRFEDRSRDADWAVVYFAGSGFQIDGDNFLVPVDAAFDDARTVRDDAIGLARINVALSSVRKLGLVVLDTCRTDPFKRTTNATPASRVFTNPDQVSSKILVFFSAGAGQIAVDQTGSTPDHSPYAAALVRHIPTPGLSMIDLFNRVSKDVSEATAGAQRPELYIGALVRAGDLMFKPVERDVRQ